jgi:ketosteroid isomerase-like protein
MANRCAVGILVVVLVLLPGFVSADDRDDLKAVQERYRKAWEARDIDTIVEIEGGTSAGFGYTTAFPRPLLTKEAFRQAIEGYFNIMEFIRVTPHTAEFRVLGDTGLVWGHYAQTTKQKSGFTRTVYLRFAHTYMKIDGKWRLVLYHRSLIPNEDVP